METDTLSLSERGRGRRGMRASSRADLQSVEFAKAACVCVRECVREGARGRERAFFADCTGRPFRE